jgi:hypothetical protein
VEVFRYKEGRMPESYEDLVYDVACRGMDRHAAARESLRTRAAGTFSAAAIAFGLLGGGEIGASGLDVWMWGALFALISIGVITILILRPMGWHTPTPADLLEVQDQLRGLDLDDELPALTRAWADWLQSHFDKDHIRKMLQRLFAVALAMLLVEVSFLAVHVAAP